jgi:methyl-accepting chemotaxis protein
MDPFAKSEEEDDLMLEWFEKKAPIRSKFDALLIAHLVIAGVVGGSVIAASMMGYGAAVLGGIVATGAVLTLIVVTSAKRMICDPYVETVLRMEALAAGNLAERFDFSDHEDCVGRMIKAMEVFRANGGTLRQSGHDLEAVIGHLQQGLGKLAEGDLTYRLKADFPAEYSQLKTSFNTAVQELGDVISSLTDVASTVQSGSSEIRDASNDLARRSEEQASALQQAAGAMKDVTAVVQETASNAANVRATIAETQGEADEGGQVVQRAVTAMGAIEKSSEQIGQIINVIDGIAFQTNLLALNAGVEAARAGDAGKGFAVVANEVRALAQRSADAAKDIKELITASTQQVSGGVALVAETGTCLAKIVQRIANIGERMSSINDSSLSQASSLHQINAAVSEMDRMTQQNAAMVEQCTAAAHSLAGNATDLTKIVARFKASGSSGGFAAPRSAPPAPRRAAVSAPVVRGNLAVKAEVRDEEDWAEF